MTSSAPYLLTIGIDPGVEPHLAAVLTQGDRIAGGHTHRVLVDHDDGLLGHPFNITAVLVMNAIGQAVTVCMNHFVDEKPGASQLTISIAIEDVAMQHRMGQSPAASLKLTHAFCVVSAAATLYRQKAGFWEDCRDVQIDFPRPQTWQAFYALGLSDKTTKEASVEMARRVVKDHKHLADERACFPEMLADPDALRDHNRCDALLIAFRDYFTRQLGWSFYKPLSQGAN